MDNVGAGSGGGIHPGAPIIWPNIKPTPTTTTESTTTESQQTQQQTPVTSTTTSSSSQALQQAAQTTSTPASTVMRNLTPQDISVQLLNMNLADTVENQQLAMKMLEFGMELSPENFKQLFTALQSKSGSPMSQLAAFTALAKGVAENSSALQSLEQFFQGSSIAKNLQSLSQSMQALQQSLQQGGSQMNAGLAANLSALLTDFDSRLKSINSKNAMVTSGNVALSAKQTAALNQLLQGGKAELSPEQRSAIQNLMTRGAPLSEAQTRSLQSLLARPDGLSDEQHNSLESLMKVARIPSSDVPSTLKPLLSQSRHMSLQQQTGLQQLVLKNSPLSPQQSQVLNQIFTAKDVLSLDQKAMIQSVLANGRMDAAQETALSNIIASPKLFNPEQREVMRQLLNQLQESSPRELATSWQQSDPGLSTAQIQGLKALLQPNSGVPISPQEQHAMRYLMTMLGMMHPEQQAVLSKMVPQLNGDLKLALEQLLAQPGLLSQDQLSLLQQLMDNPQTKEVQRDALQSMLALLNQQGLGHPKEMTADLTAFKSLISGLIRQLTMAKDPQQDALLALLKDLESRLEQSIMNLTAQGVLSKMSKYNDPALPDKYFYWMIPNPFSEKEKNIEILVRRDASKKDAPVNPERTQVVLKVETDELGDIAVIVELSGKDVWYVFNTEKAETRQLIMANSAVLREQMSVLDFKVKGFNAQVKKINIQKILSPTIDLDGMRRVSAEA